MIFSWFNFILSTTNTPIAKSTCTYNGLCNIPLFLQITYKYNSLWFASMRSKERFFNIFDNSTLSNFYVEISYDWFLDYGTTISFDNKIFKVEQSDQNNQNNSRIPIELIDCEIVCNDKPISENTNGLWGFKHKLQETMNVNQCMIPTIQSVCRFLDSNIIFLDNTQLFLMDVKNNKFEGKDEQITNNFYFIQRSEQMDQTTNKTVVAHPTARYQFNNKDDFEKLKRNIVLDDVLFIHSDNPLTHLSSKNKEMISTKRFISLKTNNQIKIKNIPENVTFEEFNSNDENNKMLKNHGKHVLNSINIVHNALSNQFKEQEEYFDILRKLCENSFDPNICDRSTSIKHLKDTFNVIYSLFQSLYKEDFVNKRNELLFPVIDVMNPNFIEECLQTLDYYLSNSDKFSENQRRVFEKAWLMIKNVLETQNKFNPITENGTNSKFKEFTKKIDEFDNIKNTQLLQKLISDIDALQIEMDNLKNNKTISEEKVSGIKNQYENIELRSKERYAKDDLVVKSKLDSLKYAEFKTYLTYLHNKRRIIEDMLKEIEDFSKKVENITDITKLNESINKGKEIDEQIKPHTEYMSSEQQLKYQKFKQVISDLEKRKIEKIEAETKAQTEVNEEDINKENTEKMSTTVIVIIVLSTLAGIGLIVGGGVYLYRRKKRMNELVREEMVE